ncbi:MAG TPA: prenyltransferase/squalene oxidase repeat-containing protein [Gemmataceae bacterium]|jgi:geranylgeranyl transferase type-2 subunit beta|nr:prenyltransferase/squalene oxidase repeat-containing protein [Gemmataceae bacterium]
MAEPYLLRLTARLVDGLSRLPSSERDCHAAYLSGTQNPDGGWSGREGDSDLYYTAFALRGLAVLDALTADIAGRAASYLRQRSQSQATVIDFFSFLYAAALVELGGGGDVLAESPPDWPDRVAATLESLRSPDGGYGKQPGAASGSTYHTFLVALCYQLLDRPLPDVEAAVRFVRTRRREDGGFVEVAPQRKSGTNPTAAAVGLLTNANALDEETTTGVADFLVSLSSVDGGLQANERAPLADLLSTFTGAWTLAELGALDRLDKDRLAAFARGCAVPTGGFRGGLWDERADVEYTFYGLGVLALCS